MVSIKTGAFHVISLGVRCVYKKQKKNVKIFNIFNISNNNFFRRKNLELIRSRYRHSKPSENYLKDYF